MSFADRIVFDPSTLVSAVLRPSSVPRRAFLKAIAEAEMCASTSTLHELESVFSRDKFDRYVDQSPRLEFIALFRRHARFLSVSESEESTLQPACRDPHDNKFLALALNCAATLVISSDEDLLSMNPYRGIPVLSPRDYLER